MDDKIEKKVYKSILNKDYNPRKVTKWTRNRWTKILSGYTNASKCELFNML